MSDTCEPDRVPVKAIVVESTLSDSNVSDVKVMEPLMESPLEVHCTR